MSEHTPDRDAGPPPEELAEGPVEPSAWRLTFGYDGEDIHLVAQQRVAMTAPPDDSPRTYAARAGTWVEVRDADGHGLYRQALADPVRHGYEAHSPTGASREVRPEARTGVFEVVVPDLPGAHDVVLHRLDDASARGPEKPPSARARKAATPPVARPVLTAELGETPPYEVS